MADTIAPTKNFQSTAILNVSNAGFGTVGSPNVTDAITLGATNQAEFYIAYAQSSLTALNIIVEVSPDKATWYQKSLLNIGGGSASGLNWSIPIYAALYSMTASGSLVIDLPVSHGYARLRVWGTGTAGSGDSVAIYYGGGAI